MIIFLSLILSGTALAEELNNNGVGSTHKRLSFVGMYGVNFGGDKFMTVKVEDVSVGDEEKDFEYDIRAGEGFVFKAGLAFEPFIQYPNWEIQTTIGWKARDVLNEASHKGSFSRYPLDVMGFYKFSKLRCGGGLTYHLNPKLTGDDVPEGIDGNFENALGIILELDYTFFNHLLTGVTYEFIEYESDTDKFEGNNVGAFIGFRF